LELKKFFNYALIKHTIVDTNSKVPLQFHQYLCTIIITLYCSRQEKNILYLDIIKEHADCRETILTVLNLLDTKYTIVRGNSPGLPVAGDAKT